MIYNYIKYSTTGSIGPYQKDNWESKINKEHDDIQEEAVQPSQPPIKK